MNNDELELLRIKNEELQKKIDELEEHLKKYTNNNRHIKYYENNKDTIKQNSKKYMEKIKETNPEKLKEWRHTAYINRKQKLQNNTEQEEIKE
jgi:hypothetical protein